jgi:hypothetical protein
MVVVIVQKRGAGVLHSVPFGGRQMGECAVFDMLAGPDCRSL